MKNISFISAVLLIIASLTLSSCKRESDLIQSNPLSENNQSGFDEIYHQITVFESENGFGEKDTRAGFWSKLGMIVGADAIGAILGSYAGPGMAVMLSVCSSISAGITCKVVGDDGFVSDTKSLIANDEIVAALGSIGLEHNQILQEFCRKDNPDFSQMSAEDKSEYIIRQVYRIVQSDDQLELPSIDICLALSSQQTMLPYNSIDELALKCTLSNPELANEIDIIKHCVQTYSTLDNLSDVNTYSKGISTIINDASIPSTSKKQIKSGASVAAFSKIYWEERL